MSVGILLFLILVFFILIPILMALLSENKIRLLIGDLYFGIGIGLISGGVTFDIISEASKFWLFLITGIISLFFGGIVKLVSK